MGIRSKTKKLLTMSGKGRRLFLEAIVLSIKYEYYLRTKKYNPIKHLHLEQQVADENAKISKKNFTIIKSVSKVIKVLEKYAPWRPKCYNRALTAKQLLLNRNIESRMHIGFQKKNDQFDGHAWLTHQSVLVTGKVKGLNKFKELSPL